LTDETGTGANVFATSPTLATPTITTSAVIPIVNGGTAVSSTLTLQSTSGAGTSDAIIFKTASQSERMRILSGGRVGINTSAPPNIFTVLESGTLNTGADTIDVGSTFVGPNYAFGLGGNAANLNVHSNSTLGADVGATIGMGGRYTGTSFAQFAIIKGAKENATDGNFATYLAFGTRANGGVITERMRIDSSGNVGIGTTSAAYQLEVYGANQTTAAITNSGNKGGSIMLSDSGAAGGNGGSVLFTAANASGNFAFAAIKGLLTNGTGPVGDLAFSTRNSFADTALTQRMVLTEAGGLGIGVASTSYKLEISTDSAGKPGVGGLWTVVSDERIKTDIIPADLDRCYEIVKSVPLKHFGFAPGVYTEDQINDKHSLGWIAQDVQKVFSKAVSVKPFTLKTAIPDGTEEYTEQDFTLETVEKTETSIQVIDGKPVQVSKVVTSENKVLLFDTVDVVDEAGAVVMDGDKPLTYQMPRMVTKTRNKVRHDVIEYCLDLNGGKMIAALYGAVQALMLQVESLTASK
jgi:hypothetical protein